MMLSKLQKTYSFLDRWHAELRNHFTPLSGSPLAMDDTDWPVVPVSQVAWMGLGSARDHLQAVRVHLEDGEVFPFAQLTLIRAALLGASQAVWVLSPEASDERIMRGRCVAAEMYRQQDLYLDVLRRTSPDLHPPTEHVAGFLKERRGQLDALRAADSQVRRLEATVMVREAAKAAMVDDSLVDEVESIWRRTSGAVHGFGWSLMGVIDTTRSGPADATGIAPFAAAGGIDRIANSYLAAFAMARNGWNFLRLRNTPA